ncbi:MAG TPA: hypothetical protein VGC88_02460 [Terriglobales bacterium]|jgi:hypothetical protein
MAIVVIGGHSRNVGKTSVVAGLIAALPEHRWTAVKITQFGHGVCSTTGDSCDCQPGADEHSWAVTEERSRDGDSDTSRYLVAGAVQSLWVRTRQGMLAEAMPRLRRRIAGAGNVIIESNSVMRFMKPDLYLPVLDRGTADFKNSARDYLDRADAVLMHEESRSLLPQWKDVSVQLFAGKPILWIRHGDYTPVELVDFVRQRLALTRAVAS